MGLLPQMNGDSIDVNNSDLHYEALEAQQRKNDKGKDMQKDPPVFDGGDTIVVQQEDGATDAQCNSQT